MSDGSYRVLVAEDEATFGLTVARFLEKRGHEVKVCPTGKAVFKFLAAQEWDVLLLDLKLPDAEGVDILAKVRKDHAELQTIIVTGFANVESAIDTMRLGAFDYLTKPPNFDELGMRVEKAGEKTLLERENRRLRFQVQRGLSSDILTRSPRVQKVLRTLEMVAAAKTPVLIEGESGVGKELMAQHLHRLSPRAGKAFVDLNCAAVPATLLESELFGHERGAFTGAGNEKPGLVEVADGGTLFLDEVGEMAPEIQSKFLRVLDSGTFYRVGATRKRRADFRLVAATNRDLRAEVAAGRFRKDLFYRIHGVRVVIPPLRDRPEDIPLLVEHFARQLPLPKRFSSGGACTPWPPTTGRATCASCTSRWSGRASCPRATSSRWTTCRPRSSSARVSARPRDCGPWPPVRATSGHQPPLRVPPLLRLRMRRLCLPPRPRRGPWSLWRTRTTTSAGTGPTPPACALRSRRAVGVGSRPPSCSAFPRGPFTVG